jgi:hypothetical protein
MNSYVIKKLLELNEKIEQMTPEEAKNFLMIIIFHLMMQTL